MWNGPKTGTLDLIRNLLKDRLPEGWRMREGGQKSLRRGRGVASRPDALLTLEAPDKAWAVLVVEAKNRIEPMDVENVLLQARSYGTGEPLIWARYLSPRTRERIVELGGNYADAAGNLRIALSRPALFIETQGSDRDPDPVPRALASLKGRAAGRVVRAVCDFTPPYGVRELAARSKTPLASVSRVLELLYREALLKRERGGIVTEADWDKIIRRWTRDYQLVTSNNTSTWLAARGLASLLKGLPNAARKYAITGSFGAAQLAPVAPPRLLAVYVESASLVSRKLDVRPAETGANVLLIEPYEKVVFERTTKRAGLVLANPSQVAADLLTSPGRGPAEAGALLAWMKDHESEWRA